MQGRRNLNGATEWSSISTKREAGPTRTSHPASRPARFPCSSVSCGDDLRVTVADEGPARCRGPEHAYCGVTKDAILSSSKGLSSHRRESGGDRWPTPSMFRQLTLVRRSPAWFAG